MAKNKSSEPAPTRSKIFSTHEITQGIEKLRSRIVQVEELKKDGLPYRDALKVTTEYQIRDTIREIFGDRSPEFHEHQHYRIKVNSKAGVDETISLLQNFVVALEEKRLHLMGFLPRPAAVPHPETNGDHTGSQPRATAPALEEPPPPQNLPQPPQSPASSVCAEEAKEADAPIPQSISVQAAAQQQQDPAHHRQDVDRAAPPPHSHQARKGKSSSEPRMKEAVPPPLVAPPPVVTPPIVSAVPEVAPTPAITPSPLISPAALPPPPVHEPVAEQIVNPPLQIGSLLPLCGQPETRAEVAVQPVLVAMPDRQKTNSDALAFIRKVCMRFHSVARQLRQRSDDRSTLEVEDEIDVQDVLRAVLCAQFEDIHTEAWNPGYANGMPRTDLVLQQEGIVIIVKKTKQGVGAKTLTDQLGVDIQRYHGHPLCKTLVCFVYDPEGRIGNPTALEAALVRQKKDRTVEVVIAPK